VSKTFHLPWPPTANTMWRYVRGRKPHLSERYEEWKKEAGWELVAQKAKPIKGPVSITIELRAPNKQAWDIDNRIKPVLDLLVANMVLPDDNSEIVREILVQAHRGEQIAVGAQVTIASLEAA
jgi:crossover junction endodeoxyribonuclease RusA